MQVITSQKELRSILPDPKEGKSIGLVPTMGALHEGHLALVAKSLKENDFTVVSIFVNPTQFNNPGDLEKYPRKLDADVDLLAAMDPEIIVFAPTVNAIYTSEVKAKTYDFEGLDTVMEGAFRPDHFDGVGTIVELLLTIVAPDRAYFGEKDYQQLAIVRKLVERQKIPVTIIGCPIVREPNGLAMSSRNLRLSAGMREEASLIYRTLLGAKEKFGTEDALTIKDWAHTQFLGHPELRLEYFELADADTLAPIAEKTGNGKYRAFIAVYAKDVRLIDNIALN